MASNIVSSAACSLCSQLYTDPRMLQCLHSFCKKCLLEEQETKDSLKCPTCKKETTITRDGVEALQKDLRKCYEAEIAHYEQKVKSQLEIGCDQCIEVSNGPAVTFCCNCCEFLCKVCTKHHKIWRKTLTHELVDVGESKTKTSEAILKNIPHKPMNCQLHEDELLKFYCEQCQTLICRDCAALEHAGHKYNRVEKVAEKEKMDLLSTLAKASSVKTKLDDAMAQSEKAVQRVQARQKSVDEEIKDTFKALYEALQTREKTLLARSTEISLGKRTALGLQHDELKRLREDTSATSEMVTKATQVYTPVEMLSAKGVMTAKLHGLLKQFEKCSLEPCESDNMYTSFDNPSLAKRISSFGSVTGGCSPAHSTADINFTVAIIGKPRKFLLTTRDNQGKQFPYGEEKVRMMSSIKVMEHTK